MPMATNGLLRFPASKVLSPLLSRYSRDNAPDHPVHQGRPLLWAGHREMFFNGLKEV